MSKKLEYNVLKEMLNANAPIGASFLSLKLAKPQATIGRVLQRLEYEGYAAKASNKGRSLTELGKQYYDRLESEYHFEEFTHGLVEVITTNNTQIYMDILNIRLLLEPYAIRLATQMITKNQLRKLENVLEKQLIKQSKGDLGEEENLEFHAMIVRFSGNKVLEQLLQIIMLKNNAYMQFPYMQYKVSLRENEHVGILQSIKEHDIEKAENLMRQHLMALVNDFSKLRQEDQ